ncbi:TonB-dependent receptor domain-containing protein [Echinicola marina]|uniref:TonB-dependent receptor domain-containing protein n=1 Tax=Echinicola marina TaxID=2859768 RepID=UPI001CF6E1D7|nr:TonB-dependent receptor [Echinicola marina]
MLCNLLPFLGFSQETQGEKVSGIYSGISFSRFTKVIEKETGYQFFFKTEDINNIEVNISAYKNDLEDILDLIFMDTGVRYTIDKEKRVFVHRSKGFYTALSDGFFEKDVTSMDEQIQNDENYLDRAYAKNKLWRIGAAHPVQMGEMAVLTGTVYGLKSKEPVFGAVINEKNNDTRVATDKNGRFSISLPLGHHTLYIQHLGQFQEQRQIELLGNGNLHLQIDESIVALDEVVVSSDRLSNIKRSEMGVEVLSVESMKKLPSTMGEVDVIKSILTLPGVKTVGESSVGFNVRGGAADQNLILLDQSTIYNPSHFFGFFSSFNADMVDMVELHKAGMPAHLGGRLSSVLDIHSKYGNQDKLHGKGGIGLLTSRLTLDGPIGKNTSFLVSGRTTYSNWLLDLVNDKSDLNAAGASFYDFYFNLKHHINDKNILKLSSYWSQDNFNFDVDTLYNYSNRNLNINWTHYFNKRLESEIIIGYDHYRFGISGRENDLNAFDFDFNISQYNIKLHFDYDFNERHSLNFGWDNIYYRLSPGNRQAIGTTSIVIPMSVNKEKANESAIFINDLFEVNEQLSFNYGLRYVLYNFLGPNEHYQYSPGLPKNESTIVGEATFANNEIIEAYHAPEIRLSARYSLDNFTSLKAGYHTTRQYIHLLTNTSAVSPTDTWKLSDSFIRPQQGAQASIGFYKNMAQGMFETSIEVYHRRMKNLIDYRSGAELLLNNEIEQDVLNTEGKAYGLELMIKKPTGRLNGWFSYSFSRSLLRTASDEFSEKVNDGNWYPSNFDQPQDLMLVANYEFNKRAHVAINANYSTGRPITLPVAKFYYNGSEQVYYSDRNAYRIPDYFRIDLALNLEGSHKVKKLAHASWSLGVYNVLGRDNPYSVYYTPVNGILKGYQLSIFAQPIPYVTYNFKF